LKESILEEIEFGGELHLKKQELKSEGLEPQDKVIDLPITDPYKLFSFFKAKKNEMNLYPFEIYEMLDFYFATILEVVGEMYKYSSAFTVTGNFFPDDFKYFLQKFYNLIVKPNYSEFQKYQDRLLVEKFQRANDTGEKLIQVIQELEGEVLFAPSQEIENRISYFEDELEKINSRRTNLEDEKDEFSAEKDQKESKNMFAGIAEENWVLEDKMDSGRARYIMLNELGVVDFLKEKFDYLPSELKLAKILSDITGKTQQDCLNSHKSNGPKNPYREPAEGRDNPVEFVKNRLRAYGVKLDE
jgi:hypothetical protein